MLRDVVHRTFSRLFGGRRGLWLPLLFILWWVFDGDSWARNLFWGLVAKMPNIYYVSMLVSFATHPIFIPIAAILLIFLALLLHDSIDWLMTFWNSRIAIPPDIRPIPDQTAKSKSIYGPMVQNLGLTDVTDCFVDLERTYWVPKNADGTWSSGGEVKFSGRLSWLESTLQSKDCKRTIERNNAGTPVRLVELELGKEMVVRLCDDSFTVTRGVWGELRLLIRVGGIANGWPIRPIFTVVTVSQMKGRGVIIGGASTRRIKRREEFDSSNRLMDATYQQMNKKYGDVKPPKAAANSRKGKKKESHREK